MRIVSINRGVRGSHTLQENAIRFAYMITEEAYGVKRRTLFSWQKTLKEGNGKLESLNCGSRAPKKKRRRRYGYRIVEEIARLREAHPNLGDKKLYPLLTAHCDTISLPCPKPTTIGRIVKDKGGMRTVPVRITGTDRVKPYKRVKALRKPKDLSIQHPGHLVALDTIEVIVHGSRRYLITCEDIYSRFAFAFAPTSHASNAAEQFFRDCGDGLVISTPS